MVATPVFGCYACLAILSNLWKSTPLSAIQFFPKPGGETEGVDCRPHNFWVLFSNPGRGMELHMADLLQFHLSCICFPCFTYFIHFFHRLNDYLAHLSWKNESQLATFDLFIAKHAFNELIHGDIRFGQGILGSA